MTIDVRKYGLASDINNHMTSINEKTKGDELQNKGHGDFNYTKLCYKTDEV